MLVRAPRYEPMFDDPWVEQAEMRDWVCASVEKERSRGQYFRLDAGKYRRLDGLALAHERRLINDHQLFAGRRYARHFSTFTDLGQYPSTLERLDLPDERLMQDVRLSAALQLRAAHAVLTPAQIILVNRVCGHGHRPELDVLRHLARPLSALQLHYGERQVAVERERLTVYVPAVRNLREEAAQVFARWESRKRRLRQIGAQAVLYRAQGGKCGVCGNKMSPRDLTIEHVYPLSMGGDPGPGNVVLSHERCNADKGSRAPGPLVLDTLARVNALLGWTDLVAHPEEVDEQQDYLLQAIAGLESSPTAISEVGAHHPAVSDVRGLGMTAREFFRRKMAIERTLRRLERLQSEPSPAPSPRARFRTTPTADLPAPEPSWGDLLPTKAARTDDTMHGAWLADAGVLKKNRDIRHLGVQAKAAVRRKAKAKGRKRRPRRKPR